MALVVLIGGLAIAGSYAWNLAKQSQAPPTVHFQASFGVEHSTSNSSGSGPADSAMFDPNQLQAFRPKNYPIELSFPAGPIKQEQVDGREQFRWTVPPQFDVSEGLAFNEIKLIIVPKVEGESGYAAIEKAKQLIPPLPPDESQVQNRRMGSGVVGGRNAFMATYQMPSRQTVHFAAYIPDRRYIYVLLGEADGSLQHSRWDAIVQSVRFNESGPIGPPMTAAPDTGPPGMASSGREEPPKPVEPPPSLKGTAIAP
ncbi:hypothetical protein [Blastopirellula retiformator]|uniref:hypothetical protein n=1 Tax=Blastopirellula retiformator TaxID=2527970 RepID=UPI0016467227|nr:hypothetical protein [Blastopirellula retiformator]